MLKARPDWFDALHLMALIKLQSGKAGAAYGLLEAALKINPRSCDALSNLGMVLVVAQPRRRCARGARQGAGVGAGRYAARSTVAASCCSSSTARRRRWRRSSGSCSSEPRISAPRPIAAMRSCELGRFEEALAQYDAVLAVAPSHAETHFNRGNALIEARPPARRDRGLRPRAGAAAGLRQGAHQSRHRAAGLQPPSRVADESRPGAGGRQGQRRRPPQRRAGAAHARRLSARL